VVQNDRTETTDPKEISNIFNSFFVSVGAKLASKFSSDTTKINPTVSRDTFRWAPIETNSVEKKIQSLKKNKATGLDGIGSRLLKAASPVLSIYLTSIFNSSLSTGYVPKCWKTKRVSPIHKNGSKTDPNNYRPISILPIPMKIFEKLVHDQISSFICEHDYLNGRQSGFRKLFSTATAVVDVSDFILSELDQKKSVCAVLIDLKKAFDTVDHKILLKKLWCFGIRDSSFNWQLTLINNTESDLLQEDAYGVPQGSVLGPLLFLLYIDDLKSVINLGYHHLYADDTIIVISHEDPDTLTLQVETELLHIDLWLKNNKMTINTDKTETIFFGNHSQLKKVENKTINYMGVPLKRSEKVKYLGVIFDQKMQWEEHIKNINQKILLKYSKIKTIASCLTPYTKNLLINALVMPHFNYCSSAWANATQGRLGKLEKRLKSISYFLGKESTFTISDLLNKNDAVLVFKAMNNIAPDYMCSKFILAKNSHSHQTRGAANNRITLPMVNTNFGKSTFSFRAAKVWNDLPSHVTCTGSLLSFKTSISSLFGKL
jgi:hypothetical protein